MKGIINKGIQEFVEDTFGSLEWDSIKKYCNCEEFFFAASKDYPDKITLELLSATASITQMPQDELMEKFGRFFMQNTGLKTYSFYYELAGKNPREFLLNMEKLFQHVTNNIGNNNLLRFQYNELPEGKLSIHYNSERKLCPILKGLLLGIGSYLDQKLEINESSCMLLGDNECAIEITVNDF